MANPLKQKLADRLQALQLQRTEKAAEFARLLGQYDAQITAIRSLAQNWDTLTVEQALTLLEQTGVSLDVRS